MKTTIVGMGEALWDVLPEGKKMGGAPANFAYHISQFGYSGVVVSAVAFIASILAGKSVAEAHKLAVEVSAYVCTQNGAMPVLPVEMTGRIR